MKWPIILFASIGILSLYLIALFTEPVELNLNELEDEVNALVIVRGVIAEKGEDSLLLQNSQGSIKVLKQDIYRLKRGDLIQVTGSLNIVNNNFFIEAREIEEIDEVGDELISLDSLSRDPEEYLGRDISTAGSVSVKGKNYYIIEKDDVKMIVLSSVEVEQNSFRIVRGSLIYDCSDFRYKVVEWHGDRAKKDGESGVP